MESILILEKKTPICFVLFRRTHSENEKWSVGHSVMFFFSENEQLTLSYNVLIDVGLGIQRNKPQKFLEFSVKILSRKSPFLSFSPPLLLSLIIFYHVSAQ